MISVLHTDSLLNPFKLLCSTCGEVWGTVHTSKPTPSWSVLIRPCSLHSDYYRIGGSFFQDFLWGITTPPEFLKKHPDLLKQEFNLMLNWIESFGESPPPFHFIHQLELSL